MGENIEANQFSLAEDALLMSIVKRWTNVVYEDKSDVVTKAEKTKAWKKIEQTFNNLSVDNKGFRSAEVLKIRSDHLERLKNRRELMHSLASGEGDAATVNDAVLKNPPPLEKNKSKHDRKEDGDGNKSTEEPTILTDNSAEKEIGLDFLQLFRMREKLLRKEIKIRIEHSRQIFEKEMEILEIKRKTLLPIQRSEPRGKPKRKTINRGEEYRQKPCWGPSIANVREDANKKVQPVRGKRRVKKVSKIDNDRGNCKRKRAGAWSRLDEGATDNEDLASLTDDDGRVKLMLERLKTRNETEAGIANKVSDDPETEGTDSKWEITDNSERILQEYRVEAMQTVQEISYASDVSLPKKLANILDKILKHDSTDELGKRNTSRTEKE